MIQLKENLQTSLEDFEERTMVYIKDNQTVISKALMNIETLPPTINTTLNQRAEIANNLRTVITNIEYILKP